MSGTDAFFNEMMESMRKTAEKQVKDEITKLKAELAKVRRELGSARAVATKINNEKWDLEKERRNLQAEYESLTNSHHAWAKTHKERFQAMATELSLRYSEVERISNLKVSSLFNPDRGGPWYSRVKRSRMISDLRKEVNAWASEKRKDAKKRAAKKK